MTEPDRPAPHPTETAPPIPSHALLGGDRRVLIEHEGEVYTLQITRQNKLLLTK